MPGSWAWQLTWSNAEIPKSYKLLAFPLTPTVVQVDLELRWSHLSVNTLGQSLGKIQALLSPSLMSVFKAGRCQAPLGLPMEQVTWGPSKLWTAQVRPDLMCPLQALLIFTAFSLCLTHSLLTGQKPGNGSPGHISRLDLIFQGIDGQYFSICYCKKTLGTRLFLMGREQRLANNIWLSTVPLYFFSPGLSFGG